MARKRLPENEGLPKRWRWKNGAYRYQVPPGKEPLWDGKKLFTLGKTLAEAYGVWADRLESPPEARTIGQLLERYALEVVPTKAPKTRTENARQLERLGRVFGHMGLTDIQPQHVYAYHAKRKAKTAAKREVEVLSHALTKAVEWGIIGRHPFKGEVRLPGQPGRDRYVEDWEIIAALGLESKRKRGSVRMVRAYIKIKLLTGMARSDLLRLQPARDFRDDGIHIQRHKTRHSTGKRTIYEWTPELRQAVEEAKAARPVDIGPYLFCNRNGEGYYNEDTGTANGFDSIWQRYMARVLAETEVQERFTEHDLRAAAGSDADSLEHARALLSHADTRTTQRFYRRAPERVKPTKRRFE